MKRLDFYKTYTEETDRATELLPVMHDQTCIDEMTVVHDILQENGYPIHDFQFVGLIAAIYRVGIAVGIRTERKRRQGVTV